MNRFYCIVALGTDSTDGGFAGLTWSSSRIVLKVFIIRPCLFVLRSMVKAYHAEAAELVRLRKAHQGRIKGCNERGSIVDAIFAKI